MLYDSEKTRENTSEVSVVGQLIRVDVPHFHVVAVASSDHEVVSSRDHTGQNALLIVLERTALLQLFVEVEHIAPIAHSHDKLAVVAQNHAVD